MITNSDLEIFNDLLDRYYSGIIINSCSDYEIANTPDNLLTIEGMYRFEIANGNKEFKSYLKALERGYDGSHICVDDFMMFNYLRNKIVPRTKE